MINQYDGDGAYAGSVPIPKELPLTDGKTKFVPVQREMKYPAIEKLRRWQNFTTMNGKVIEEIDLILSRCEQLEKVNKILSDAAMSLIYSASPDNDKGTNVPNYRVKALADALTSAKAIAGEE